MTVITPGGPCLTQTQIAARELQASYAAKGGIPQAGAGTDGVAQPNSSLVTAPEKTDTGSRSRGGASYGGKGGSLLDISV